MVSELLSELIHADTPQQVESVYEKAYRYFENHTDLANAAHADIETLLDFIDKTDQAFAQSYALLFIGAIFDHSTAKNVQEVIDVLMGMLNNLSDFRVFDEKERFVHFLNHALFLAESALPQLLENEQKNILKALLDAYLRAGSVFRFNEDLLLANLLLQYHDDASGIIKQLYPSEILTEASRDIFANQSMNKRLLWMSIRLLSEASESHFHTITDELKSSYLTNHLT